VHRQVRQPADYHLRGDIHNFSLNTGMISAMDAISLEVGLLVVAGAVAAVGAVVRTIMIRVSGFASAARKPGASRLWYMARDYWIIPFALIVLIEFGSPIHIVLRISAIVLLSLYLGFRLVEDLAQRFR